MSVRSMLLLIAPGCAGVEEVADAPLRCVATVNEIPTLLDVGWEAPQGATRSWVDYTTEDGGAYSLEAAEPSGVVGFTLFGAGPEEVIAWTASSEVDGVVKTCSANTMTGSLDPSVPNIAVTVDDGAWDPDVRYFLGVFYELMADTSHVFVIDRRGAFLWYTESEPGTVSVDVHVPRDGQGLYFNQFQRDVNVDDSAIRRVDWSGHDLERTQTPGGHHTFAELPDGTLAYNQVDIRDVVDEATGDAEPWVGDAVAEVQPQGVATTVFSVWDWLPPVYKTYMDEISLYGGLDWTHGNLVRYDDASGRYLLSLAHAETIFEIDRATGTPTRELGPPGYAFTDGSTPFAFQHNALLEPGGSLMVFSSPADGSNSGAYEYAVDDAAGTLTETWHAQGDMRGFCLGQAIPLPTDDVLINYGCGASLQEVDRAGVVHWQLDAIPGAGFGQVTPLRTLPWESQ